MTRLIPCSSCHSHVRVDDRECPHCGASLRTTTASLRTPVVLMGLALAGCPAEPEYGVPDTGPVTTTASTGNDTEGSDSGSGSGSGSGGSTTGMTDDGTASGTTAAGTTSVDEPEYGVPDTGQASTSAGEPDYGVPETTSG